MVFRSKRTIGLFEFFLKNSGEVLFFIKKNHWHFAVFFVGIDRDLFLQKNLLDTISVLCYFVYR